MAGEDWTQEPGEELEIKRKSGYQLIYLKLEYHEYNYVSGSMILLLMYTCRDSAIRIMVATMEVSQIIH